MSVLPAKKNYVLWRGATWRKQLTLHTGSTDTSPLRNLTGYTARMGVVALDGTPLFELTQVSSVNGQILLGGAGGTVTILIPATVTAGLTWTSARFEIDISAPDPGDTDPLIWGGLTVKGI